MSARVTAMGTLSQAEHRVAPPGTRRDRRSAARPRLIRRIAKGHEEPRRVDLRPVRAVLAVRAVPDVRALDVHPIACHWQRPRGKRTALPLDLHPAALVLF